MKIAVASDHAGFHHLQELKKYLSELGHEPVDFGPSHLNPKDDYPDFVVPAAKAVSSEQCPRGIIIGGDGQGEAMAANRLKGVRCGVFYGPVVARGVVDQKGRISHDPYEVVRLLRLHNNSNMLSLGARFIGVAGMKHAVRLWLETGFAKESRHVRRNAKLDKDV